MRNTVDDLSFGQNYQLRSLSINFFESTRRVNLAIACEIYCKVPFLALALVLAVIAKNILPIFASLKLTLRAQCERTLNLAFLQHKFLL